MVRIIYRRILFIATGAWGQWGGYGECSSVCGGGIRTRLRECTAVTHSIGEPQCEGMEYSIETCNANQCGKLLYKQIYTYTKT